MNKASDRSKKMRAMFGGVDPSELSKEPATLEKTMAVPAKHKVSAGAIKSMRSTFSNVEKENEKLRQMMAEGGVVQDLDPELMDPSFVADRIAVSIDEDFEALKESIAASGQQVPILARPHPQDPERYQIAFGHRRWRACRELGIAVKGFVKALSDEELLIAQGQENHERKNLSFIETALFAHRLSSDYPQTVISKAIGKDATTVSKLLRLTNGLPEELIRKIGPAPKIGRPRWEELSGFFSNGALPAGLKKKVDALVVEPAFDQQPSDERFAAVLEAVKVAASPAPSKDEKKAPAAKSWLGNKQVMLKESDSALNIQVDVKKSPALASFLKARLPELLKEFEKTSKEGS
ncbi:plasmid partitioning protein RepB [Rhodobacteraceae bacterium RKSG542]|uniref:plasmid partitioning protein RepB n=1 Tax=Pseudovibrio flavus TaxID=2529854 RepID=UPI0012BB4E79|nr:plasmid partitioning protein RepB [Pseudovibrio flavus]MTI16173.1 plasmid partitioning protein RepB [Pseudovibrio flavus]